MKLANAHFPDGLPWPEDERDVQLAASAQPPAVTTEAGLGRVAAQGFRGGRACLPLRWSQERAGPHQLTQLPWPVPFHGTSVDFLKPLAPLVAGERYLTRNNCGRVEQAFEVTANRPLPTTLGTLSVAKVSLEVVSARTYCGGPDRSSCSVKAAVAQLKIAPSSELAPFVGTVGWALKVLRRPYKANS